MPESDPEMVVTVEELAGWFLAVKSVIHDLVTSSCTSGKTGGAGR